MKTANLAIVFTDIKGFTERTSRQTLEENERLLETHWKLLGPLFEAMGGTIIKMIGDAFMVTFESPTQAVLCGAAIQDRLWIYNRSAPANERLDVRVAINVGEVRMEKKDVFGEPVNIAARVEGLADAGDVFFTESVYLSMNKAEVPSELVGDFELKGIPGKIKVFRVPRAPYRVEAAAAGVDPNEAPPYGNLGLSRVKEETLLEKLAARPSVELRHASDKLSAAVSTLSKDGAPSWLNRRVLLGAGVGVVVSLALIVAATAPTELESAIEAVGKADEGARGAQVRKAEALLEKVEDPEEKLWYAAQLEEAQESFPTAVQNYARAAKKGSSRSERRLLKLLDHDSCRARTAAARTLGDLALKRAKGPLEELAEEGGPGDGAATGFLGLGSCDSRKAAREALRQLE